MSATTKLISPTLNDELSSLFGQFKLGIKYLLTRKGELAMSVNQAGGFFHGDAQQAHPNLQLYFNPLSYQIPKNNKASLKPEPYSGFLLCFNSCRADQLRARRNRFEKSTGRGADRSEPSEHAKGYRRGDPGQSPDALDKVLPGDAVQTGEQTQQFFRDNCRSIYHLCGSCAMGVDEQTSVVHKRIKLPGLAGLRIFDASIFPKVTSGNTHAAVMMVAEKGADLILEGASTVKNRSKGVRKKSNFPHALEGHNQSE